MSFRTVGLFARGPFRVLLVEVTGRSWNSGATLPSTVLHCSLGPGDEIDFVELEQNMGCRGSNGRLKGFANRITLTALVLVTTLLAFVPRAARTPSTTT